MEIFEANENYRNALSQFYLEQGYHSDWGVSERAFIAVSNNEIIGSVKVESKDGVAILRGMYIAREFQGLGVGTSFIRHIEPILNKSVSYCLPFSHLADFYRRIGFKVIKPDSLPGFLDQRYREYEEKGNEIIAMCREQTV